MFIIVAKGQFIVKQGFDLTESAFGVGGTEKLCQEERSEEW